jgi:hypothetical protein
MSASFTADREREPLARYTSRDAGLSWMPALAWGAAHGSPGIIQIDLAEQETESPVRTLNPVPPLATSLSSHCVADCR